MSGNDEGGLPPDYEDIIAMRQEVLARVAEEADGQPEPEEGEGPPEVTPRQVYQCLHANELGDGTLFASLFRGRFVYDKNAAEWLKWMGHHWDRDLMEEALAAVARVAEAYLREADALSEQVTEAQNAGREKDAAAYEAKRKRLLKRVDRLRSVAGRNNALEMAHTIDDPLAIRGDELDRNPMLLACPNGVIDLRTGVCRSGRPDDWLFKAATAEWRGLKEPAPVFERALSEIFSGDQELVDYMGRLCGYGITGLTTEHVLPVLWGQGRNGKGLLIEALHAVLGNLAGPIQSEMLLDQGRARSASGPSPDIMALRGMRLVFASETDDGRKISPSRVKWLSGGDTLVGRRPHDKHETSFEATHLLFLLTNHLPHAPPDDFAFWERVHLVPFKLSFVNREPRAANERPADKTLPAKLAAEASGILAWLVRGCLEWQVRGLDPPPVVKNATAEYRRDEDLVADFIDECCELGDDLTVQASGVYAAFVEWYERNVGPRPPKQKKFGTMLGARFKRDKLGGLQHYFGLGLRVAAP